ncbi:hypothetical protein VTK26DRAFT_2258 [Humicola hyalothermophila]
MLLPSALPCDSSQTAPVTRLQAALFSSPPPSPPQVSTQTAIGSLFTTCRSLQSLLASPPPSLSNPNAGPEPITPPTSSHAQLPTPPMAHAPPPPLKLRLRSRKTDSATAGGPDLAPPRKRIVKRSVAVAPARGANKRRRAVEDDTGRGNGNNGDESGSDMEQDEPRMNHSRQPSGVQDEENEPRQPTTPKRSRIAPEVLPLGLDRADFHELHHADAISREKTNNHNNNKNGFPPSSSTTTTTTATTTTSLSSSLLSSAPETAAAKEAPGTDVVVEADGETWSTEEDRILVELVLEKLRLTKSEWQDCARSLGKDRGSVGRRWKSLMVNGDVGLRRGASRRARLHGTWR